ncbi:MAG: NAD-dependent epimerase/dehydratase family protein [Actinomycetota bacterium]|nr:NAD-dependent epimerase/dehydratase family protein [Actinomycetota bacterium]
MSVVAVTGCSGYIGSRLLDFIESSDKFSRIIGVDVKPPRQSISKLDFHHMDVRDPAITNLFTLNDVKTVVHLAFVVDPLHDDTLMHDIDVNGTRNVLSTTAACGAGHLVIASSSTAFGVFPDNPEWLDENDHIRCMRTYTYASDKYENEINCRFFKEDNPRVKIAVVRPCIVYGPNVDNYISRFVLKLPFVPGVGGARPDMQFVHEDDAAEVFMKVLEKEAEGNFHAVGEGVINIAEFAAMAGKRVIDIPPGILYPAVDIAWRLHAPLVEAPAAMLDFIRYRWTISGEITREALGLGPRWTSKEVVRLMLETHGKEVRDRI